MVTSRFIILKKTHFDFFLGFMYGFLCRNMFPLVYSSWVFLSKLFVYVLGSIIGYFFRFPTNRYLEEIGSGEYCLGSNFDDDSKNKPSSDHVDQGNIEEQNYSLAASTSKYEYLCNNGIISGFIEEPKTGSYTVHEFYKVSGDTGDCNCKVDSADEDIGKIEVEREDVIEVKLDDPLECKTEEFNERFTVEKNLVEEPEECFLRFSFLTGFEKQIKKEEEPDEEKITFEEKADESVENFIVEKVLEKPKREEIEKAEDSVSEKRVWNKNIIEGKDDVEEKLGSFFDGAVIDKYLEKWKHEKEYGEIFSPENKIDVESMKHEVLTNKVDSTPESYLLMDGQTVENMDHETIRSSISDFDDEFIELELGSGNLLARPKTTESGEDLSMEESKVSTEKAKEPILIEEGEEEEEDDSEFGSENDDDDDDLIVQLKMEMKMARTGGLPTILEESESPVKVQQLGPLQINEKKYDHKDHIDEIQKVYKSYSNKMKKLDILNSQTIHAISLLQLKDPVRLGTSGKSSAPAVRPHLSHKVLSPKQRKLEEADPAMKFIKDLHKDFETVYVGQVCLSWEILHWQLGKLKKLLECDGQGIRKYNQVSGEFQHFQVLVERFVEDEPFQARPRVENYVNNRCALRHLLQVPVIQDDCSKYRNGDGNEKDVVSSEMLTDIIEESMHVFWEFLRADKDEANIVTSKTPQQAQVAPHDPIDLELLMDVRTELQKKEKKMKEIQRSTNCILKKFQRQEQGNLLDHALFIAQVELKLVSRVLNMLKISTDQLIWCHEKLQKIKFSSSSRKVEVEPSFTLFPC